LARPSLQRRSIAGRDELRRPLRGGDHGAPRLEPVQRCHAALVDEGPLESARLSREEAKAPTAGGREAAPVARPREMLDPALADPRLGDPARRSGVVDEDPTVATARRE